jgi:hypothetical protein
MATIRASQTTYAGRAPILRREWMWHVAVLSIPLALACIQTYPVVAEITTRAPGWPGDNIAYIWLIHWLKQAVTTGASLFFDPYFYYPLGYNLSAIESTLANTVPALPVALLAGPVAAYNTVLLASFALTSYGTFLWVRALTGNNAVALTCGVASAFFPFRLAHLPGHLPQMSTQWIPLCFYAVERYTRTRQTYWAAGVGVMVGLNALSSWYTLVFVALALPVYVLLRVPRLLRQIVRTSAARRDLAVAVVATTALVAPAAAPYLHAQGSDNRARSAAEIVRGSISPLEFVTLSVRHPIWGEWAAAHLPIAEKQNIVERVVMPGYLMLATASVGVWLSRRRRVVRSLCGLACVGIFGAMGPVLVDHTARPVQIAVPASMMNWLEQAGVLEAAGQWFGPEVAASMRDEQGIIVPLPYALIYRLPVIASMRAVGRFAILLNFAVCGLAAVGADALIRRLSARMRESQRIRQWLAALVLCAGGLVVFEYWQKPYQAVRLRARAVDVWLAEQPFGAVLELPLDQFSQRLSVYARAEHRQPLVLGLRGSFPPPVDGERRAIIEQLPAPEAVQALCEWGTRYVVLNMRRMTREEQIRWAETMEAMPVARLAGEWDLVRGYVLDECQEVGPQR